MAPKEAAIGYTHNGRRMLGALIVRMWRLWQRRSRRRKPSLERLPDYLLTDVGLHRSGYERPTSERYFHR